MTVYQCLNCRNYYGSHENKKVKKHLRKSIDTKTYHRYLDSDTWRCPYCNTIQDTRDIQPFLGVGGNRMLRQLSEEDIAVIFLGQDRQFYTDEDDWFYF